MTPKFVDLLLLIIVGFETIIMIQLYMYDTQIEKIYLPVSNNDGRSHDVKRSIENIKISEVDDNLKSDNVQYKEVKISESTHIKKSITTNAPESMKVTGKVFNVIKTKTETLQKQVTEYKQNKLQPDIPYCSQGDSLAGPMFVSKAVPKSLENVQTALNRDGYGKVKHGGWWAPTKCQSKVKVAIIIPYRNRFTQLKIFLNHMHPVLQRQNLYYRIFTVEQVGNTPFNRASLFNVGYIEALKLDNFNCFVFTDVDLLPENDYNYYGCPTSPLHMSVYIDNFNYKLSNSAAFGGTGAFTKEHFEKINGMSNLFWGWGGEDDDLSGRIRKVGYNLTRPAPHLARYQMVGVEHFRSTKPNPDRYKVLNDPNRHMETDGLNSLKYNLHGMVIEHLYTMFKVHMEPKMYEKESG